MKSAEPKVIDQLRHGGLQDFIRHLESEQARADRDLRSVSGDVHTGRVQGEANCLETILKDFERAGLRA